MTKRDFNGKVPNYNKVETMYLYFNQSTGSYEAYSNSNFLLCSIPQGSLTSFEHRKLAYSVFMSLRSNNIDDDDYVRHLFDNPSAFSACDDFGDAGFEPAWSDAYIVGVIPDSLQCKKRVFTLPE